ncbi:MAG TPA: hypothetical protein VMH35_03175 [Streptosporangiaceae bacterium]|nr:hypothetical protein [Streptosporangiaceae bacterium]
MTVPVYARYVFFALGLFLVVIDGNSVVGTLIVPRPAGGRLMVWVDRANHAWFGLVTAPIGDYRRRDQVLAAEAATLLIWQLVAWLGVAYLGFTLMLWPFVPNFSDALDTAGPALWFIGDSSVHGWGERLVQYAAAFFGLVTVTLQIAYLPTLYSAFNRRETDIALLNARAGVPSWGPELLARTHYALGSGQSTIGTLPDFYEQWERWAADIAESHTTYLPLVRFRSPRPLSSWVTALLSVLDSAAMYLALSPNAAPTVQARLCLRSGFQCFGDIARALGTAVPLEPDTSQGISLTYDDFLKGIAHMRKVDFPIERDPADAWPDFVGWRVNYEQAAYAVARNVNAVPALWSGPRKHKVEQIAPFRPSPGHPPTVRPHRGSAARARAGRNHQSEDQGAPGHPAVEPDHEPADHPARERPRKEPATEHPRQEAAHQDGAHPNRPPAEKPPG